MEDPTDDLCTEVYSLPSWILSNCSEAEKKDIRQTYLTLKTAANGDCLFHSIHLFLISPLGWKNAYTTYELRYAVAKTVLDLDNHETTRVLDSWKSLLQYAQQEQDLEIQEEYKHAQPLLDDESPFCEETRLRLFNNMLNKTMYWGDQYAVQVLERLMQVRFLILKKGRDKQGRPICQGQVGIEHPPDFSPTWFGIFILKGNHYLPIAKRRFVKKISKSGKVSKEEEYITSFRENQVPPFIMRAFQQH